MVLEPSTWVVGGSDDHRLATRCLLSLQGRFALPETVRVCHLSRWREAVPAAPARVLAIVADPPGATVDFLGLLGRKELSTVMATPDASMLTAAVGVARTRSNPVDDAVHLVVTTLIDWGHEIAARR